MKRHFYLSNDLDDLETLQTDLDQRGIERPQVHTLSNEEAELDKHQLNQVESLLRKDMVHSSLIGFAVGIFVAAIPLVVAYFVGVADPYVWIPVAFLSLILLGFCTWEGGLIGIHRPNYQFEKFERELQEGNHLMVVDVTDDQDRLVQEVAQKHPSVRDAGVSKQAPAWLAGVQRQWGRFTRWAP